MNLNRRLLFGASALAALWSKETEVSAWPGFLSSSGASACPAPPTVTPPTGTVYSTTGFSGSTAANGGGDVVAFNATLSPDNTVDAMQFTEGTANNYHSAEVSGGELTHSFSGSVSLVVFLKQGSGTRNVYISMNDPSFAYTTAVIVNPSTGAIVQAASTNFPAASAWASVGVPTSNGFWRFDLHTSTITQSGIYWGLFTSNGTTVSYAGNGTSSFYAWGGAVFSP